MIISPDLPTLPFRTINGIKYFELVAEPVTRELLPGLFIKGWGYNGCIPGPTIHVLQGDYVNIRVYNRLPEPTSVHWHGLTVPNMMDGVPDVEPSPLIEPDTYFDYRFRIVNPPGTHMYHTHHKTAKQQMTGLGGGLIILNPKDYKADIITPNTYSRASVSGDSFRWQPAFSPRPDETKYRLRCFRRDEGY